MPMRSTKPILVASAVLLLSSVIVHAASPENPARARIELENGKSEEEHERIRSTKEIIEHFIAKYKVNEWDKKVTDILQIVATKFYLSETERNGRFEFLREATLAYDNYAEELFWCWKGRRCHPGTMKDHCSTFSSLIEQLTMVDKTASRDPAKREVDTLLGEDEHQNYVSLQMPNVTLYLVYLCRDYRYQSQFLPNGRYHREE